MDQSSAKLHSNLSFSSEDPQKDKLNELEILDPTLNSKSAIEYSSRGALIHLPKIYNSRGEPVNCLVSGKKYDFEYKVKFEKNVENVRFAMLIKSLSGSDLGGAVTVPNQQMAIAKINEGSVFSVRFSFDCNLNEGLYFFNAGVMGGDIGNEIYLHRILDIYAFRVFSDQSNIATALIDFKPIPEIRQLIMGNS